MMDWLLTVWGAIDFNGTVVEVYNAHMVAAGTAVLLVLIGAFMLGMRTRKVRRK